MNGYDLLTLFLENTETFSDHCIESNLIGFIFGAIETTNFASQTIISHLAQSKESLEKVRKDFEDNIYNLTLLEDPSVAKLSKDEFL